MPMFKCKSSLLVLGSIESVRNVATYSWNRRVRKDDDEIQTSAQSFCPRLLVVSTCDDQNRVRASSLMRTDRKFFLSGTDERGATDESVS